MNTIIDNKSYSARRRQIGRKVLQAERVSRLLEADKHSQAKSSRLRFRLNKKLAVIVGVILVVASAGGAAGYQHYARKASAAKFADMIERQKALKAKSEAADKCRQEKAEQKAHLIGNITYDELYDYGECDK
jgi:hypothetical protein